ncbi:putative zinc finger protein [Trypanosoma grayi]|uniref:putative zinc finger protein n=1 Tax=Trypanosoma grayi TaxID=71804 RepID=UPI0004F44FB9|nr:putative zinc finger protein [Trypanosoma grayi]KEG12220.1 putative zinc finger protein [Trypanosoma grayi]
MIARRSFLGEWKADGAVLACERCSAKFTFSRRRHHCRYCGGIFCASCSNMFLRIPNLRTTKPQRICLTCCASFFKPISEPAPSGEGGDGYSRQSGDAPGFGHGCLTSSAKHTAPSDDDDTSVLQASQTGDDVGNEVLYEGEYCDSETDSDDVSAAVAGVYSSVDDGQCTNSISFIAALQDNLRYSEDPDVISVLMYVSPSRYQVIYITVDDNETMSMLVRRLVDDYFRLENGPFKSLGDTERDVLLSNLRFSSESVVVDDAANAIDVTSQYKHLVLSTLPARELQRVRRDNSIRDFFRSEHSAEDGDDMKW